MRKRTILLLLLIPLLVISNTCIVFAQRVIVPQYEVSRGLTLMDTTLFKEVLTYFTKARLKDKRGFLDHGKPMLFAFANILLKPSDVYTLDKQDIIPTPNAFYPAFRRAIKDIGAFEVTQDNFRHVIRKHKPSDRTHIYPWMSVAMSLPRKGGAYAPSFRINERNSCSGCYTVRIIEYTGSSIAEYDVVLKRKGTTKWKALKHVYISGTYW